jgi:hypothetical protein
MLTARLLPHTEQRLVTPSFSAKQAYFAEIALQWLKTQVTEGGTSGAGVTIIDPAPILTTLSQLEVKNPEKLVGQAIVQLIKAEPGSAGKFTVTGIQPAQKPTANHVSSLPMAYMQPHRRPQGGWVLPARPAE